jgi:hypothetical protein
MRRRRGPSPSADLLANTSPEFRFEVTATQPKTFLSDPPKWTRRKIKGLATFRTRLQLGFWPLIQATVFRKPPGASTRQALEIPRGDVRPVIRSRMTGFVYAASLAIVIAARSGYTRDQPQSLARGTRPPVPAKRASERRPNGSSGAALGVRGRDWRGNGRNPRWSACPASAWSRSAASRAPRAC